MDNNYTINFFRTGNVNSLKEKDFKNKQQYYEYKKQTKIGISELLGALVALPIAIIYFAYSIWLMYDTLKVHYFNIFKGFLECLYFALAFMVVMFTVAFLLPKLVCKFWKPLIVVKNNNSILFTVGGSEFNDIDSIKFNLNRLEKNEVILIEEKFNLFFFKENPKFAKFSFLALFNIIGITITIISYKMIQNLLPDIIGNYYLVISISLYVLINVLNVFLTRNREATLIINFQSALISYFK
ncbi:MAG: hypothetical protein ACRCWG_03300 [Sarcina sp.]